MTNNNDKKILESSVEREQSEFISSAECEKIKGSKNLNVPALRFPEFTEEWEEHYLSEYLDFKNGLNPSANKFGSGIKFISVMDILNNDFITYDCIRISVEITPEEQVVFAVEKGDMLFQRSSETLEDVGRANVYMDDRPAVFGGFVIRGKKKDEYNPMFFRYLLASPYARKKVIPMGAGAQHFNIGQDGLSKVKLHFPILQEQQKIADLLRLINERISTQNKIIEKLETLIRGIRDNIVLKIKGEYITLQDIADIYQPQTIASTNLTEDGYLVYGANGVIGKYHSYNHDKEQICITCRGNKCGTVNFTEPKSWITGNAMVINTDNFANNVNKRYLFHYLSFINFNSIISGSGQPQIVRQPLAKLKVILPALTIQEHIAECLDAILAKTKNERSFSQILQKQKLYLLSKLFI